MTHTEQYLRETIQIAKRIHPAKVEEMVSHIVSLRERNGRLFIIGLGGSAANASHATNDFKKLCDIRAYCATDNVAYLTAIANDDGWKHCFSYWLASEKAQPEDTLLVLSVGGGTDKVSIPITHCITAADMYGMEILGIVGRDGGVTAQWGHHSIIIPTVNPDRVTPHTEGWQSVILHAIVSHPDLQQRPTKW